MADENNNEQASSTQGTGARPGLQKGKAAAAEVSLEDYLSRVKVHMGLVASFRYEARFNPDLSKDKTDEQWAEALKRQSQAQYK
ncbi:hypothetical protein [Paenibacillus massiliensis]|uniref:hypothetical protein n=1 Tax=Paenibacillus massiliensis TaxID=225917 RepID=UPI0004056458|nr:hypothetical protein [Paenibacillus massiliensis]